MNQLNNLPTELHSAALSWVGGSDDHIAYLARISNPQNQEQMRTLESILNFQEEGSVEYLETRRKLKNLSARLINFCVKEGHVSILETANMCVTIKTTLDIAAQILRHRSFSFQQYSQRYAAMDEETSMPTPKGLAESPRNPSVPIKMDSDLYEEGQALLRASDAYYRKLLELDYHPEFARKFRTVQTPTYIAMNGTVRSWFFYLRQRNSEHAQYEHQLVAQSVEELLAQEFPLVYEAYCQ